MHDPPRTSATPADNGAISYATGRPLRIDTSDWSDEALAPLHPYAALGLAALARW